MTPLLIHHLAEYEYLREQLQAEYQEADEETTQDTLEGISSLPEALAAFVRSYLTISPSAPRWACASARCRSASTASNTAPIRSA